MSAVIDRTISRIAWIMVSIAALALMVVVAIIMAEVTLRALRMPLVGGIELIRVTFLVAVFFAFAHLIVSEREIRVDAIRSVIPTAALPYMDVLAAVISTAFFGFLFWFSTDRLYEAWERGVYLEGRLLIPMWIPWGTIVCGAGMAVVAALALAVKSAVTPPVPVDPIKVEERASRTS